MSNMTPCVKVNRVVSKNTNELKTRTPPISSLVGGDAVRRLMETKSERGRGRGLAYSVTCLTALRRGHAAPPNRREVDDAGGSSRSAQRAGAVDNGADDVGGHEGIADGLAHAGLWDGVFGGNLLIGFARRGRWRYCAGGCGQPILGSCRCLRCLLLVMCTYPIAKKAFTLHLARGEGRERYFGCNLMQRKVLASSHQQQTAQAPHRTGWCAFYLFIRAPRT